MPRISLVVLKHRNVSRTIIWFKSWDTAILKAGILKPLSRLPNLWKCNFPEISWCFDSPHSSVSRSKGLAPGFDHGLDSSVPLLILYWQLISPHFYSSVCCMQHTGTIDLIQAPWYIGDISSIILLGSFIYIINIDEVIQELKTEQHCLSTSLLIGFSTSCLHVHVTTHIFIIWKFKYPEGRGQLHIWVK